MTTDTIIGIGPARSGTRSLAHLLQEWGLDVGHESTTSVPWALDRPVREERMRRDLAQSDGDVACWLTQAAPKLLSNHDSVRCLALCRDKEDTVQSLADHFGELRIRASKPFGPMCFPTYEAGTLREAWSWYYEDCREIMLGLRHKYPSRVLPVKTEQLAEEDTQRGVARFLGVCDWHHVEECHITDE